jgi:hypothetical protein
VTGTISGSDSGTPGDFWLSNEPQNPYRLAAAMPPALDGHCRGGYPPPLASGWLRYPARASPINSSARPSPYEIGAWSECFLHNLRTLQERRGCSILAFTPELWNRPCPGLRAGGLSQPCPAKAELPSVDRWLRNAVSARSCY